MWNWCTSLEGSVTMATGTSEERLTFVIGASEEHSYMQLAFHNMHDNNKIYQLSSDVRNNASPAM